MTENHNNKTALILFRAIFNRSYLLFLTCPLHRSMELSKPNSLMGAFDACFHPFSYFQYITENLFAKPKTKAKDADIVKHYRKKEAGKALRILSRILRFWSFSKLIFSVLK